MEGRAELKLAGYVERWRGCLVGWFASLGLEPAEAVELAQETVVLAHLDHGRGATGDDETVGLEAQGEWLRHLASKTFDVWSKERRRRGSAQVAPGEAQATEGAAPRDVLADLELLPQHLSAPLYMALLGAAPSPAAAALLGVEESTLAQQLEQGLRELIDRRAGGAPAGREVAGGTRPAAQLLREALAPSQPRAEPFLSRVLERIDDERADPARSPSSLVRGVARLLPQKSLREELLRPFLPAHDAPRLSSIAAALMLAPAFLHLGLAARLSVLVGPLRARDLDPGARFWELDLAWAAKLLGIPGHGVPRLVGVVLASWILLPGATLTLLAISMVLLALGLSRRRAGTTLSLGAVIGALLLAMGLLAFWLGPTFLGEHLGRFLLALWSAGALLCALSALVSGRGRPVVLALIAGIACAYLGALALQRPASRAALVRYVEEFDPAPPGLHGADWALVAGHLAGDGGAQPDWSAFAARLHRHLDAGHELDLSLLHRAARLGLLRERDWRAFDAPARVEPLLREVGPIPVLETATLPLLARQNLEPWSGAQRAHLVRRLVASVTPDPAKGSLARSLLVVELLEHLDAPQALADLTAILQAQLSESWQGSLHDRPRAPFSSPPGLDEPFEGSSFGAFYILPTCEALALAARVGLPPDIEAWRVRLFLEQHSRGRFLPQRGADSQLVAAAGLRTLERLAPHTPIAGSHRIHLLRLLAPAVLLVLAGVIAAALAARGPERPARALPSLDPSPAC